MWKYAKASVRGSAHLTNGLPCQDWSAIHTASKDKSVLLCALSDGAGSAKFADEAARFLVSEAIRFLETQLADHPKPSELIAEYDRSDGEAFIEQVQGRLRQMAEAQSVSLGEYSATLLFAAIHPEWSIFFQIGDGCWIVARESVFGAVTWPTQGEFVGQTVFVASAAAKSELQIQKLRGSLRCVVGITDGLERLALDLRGRVPHPGFFAPLVNALSRTTDTELFEKELVAFLESERVCERTDDDKSIILVTQHECCL